MIKMKEFKNYKEYFVNNETWRITNKIKNLRELYNMFNKDIEGLENWKKGRYSESLTTKQTELLYNNNIKELKPLLKKQIEKENKKLIIEKENAINKYNKIKELGDIEKITIDVEWSSGRGAYGYQTKGFARVWYKNGDFDSYETSYTGGCGYDKPSATLAELCNKLLKIVFVKHGNKILKDNEKHYKFYAGEGLYFQGGVGVSSYETFFKNLKYKTNFQYLRSENIYIEISK